MKWIPVLSLFLLVSTNALAQPRHVVFLIHGIGSSAKHFKTTESVLQAAMQDSDPAFFYEFVRFEYDTGDDKKTTFDFAKDLGKSISAHFEKTSPIATGEKISLVTHSQGGLVGLIWLWHAFLPDANYHPEYAPHIDAFVTLGTPFWGAKIATFAHKMKDLALKLHVPFPFALGVSELREMSFGSETIFSVRRAAIKPEFQDVLQRIRAQVRPLSLGGIVKSLRALTPFSIGTKEYEDDTAVPLPSARFDFLYATAGGPYSSGDVIPYEEFQETSLGNLHVVNALHLSPAPEKKSFPGIAQLPARCAQALDCDHPSFSHIVAHLAGEKTEQDERTLRKLTGFLVDVSIRLPPGAKIKPRQIKLRFSPENYGWNPLNKDLKVGHPLEFYSRGRSKVTNHPEYVRFYFTGTARNSYTPPAERSGKSMFEDRKLVFKVTAPGFKSRVIEAKVRATYTTFIQLNLEPK